MASDPDPRDFVNRADTGLTLLGTPLRFGGIDVPWLGLRQDGAAPARRPTEFELRDALQTVRALGGTVVRSGTLAGSVGCALCLEPSAGHFDDTAFAQLDLVLKIAGDAGLKLILPLAGRSPACGGPVTAGDAAGSICTYLTWHGLSDRNAFFTDAGIRADFLLRVRTILNHVNTLTGVAYHDDPAILAWENCEACGEGADPDAVGAWVEAVGQAIKAADTHHLYENGAFAGHILPQSAHPVRAAVFATPSVDIVGDSGLVPGDLAETRHMLAKVTEAVTKAGRAYVLDSFGWGPGLCKTEADLELFLAEIVRQRALAGALVGDLQGHADQGGYLPAPPASPDGQVSALYFPGAKTAEMDQPEMEARARALRRFEFSMADVTLSPAYLLPPKPEIIGATHGHVVWRGAAGALDYTIERSPDPMLFGSWTVVCDRCATDSGGGWTDPAFPQGPAWYRVMPFNINGHKARPSEPFRAP